jgi:hypothetical protein
MAWIRIGIGLVATILGALIAWVLVAVNGYQVEYGSGGFHTLGLGIAVAAITAAVAVLTVGAILSSKRRDRWSRWAVELLLAFAIVLLLIAALDSLVGWI